MQTEMITMMIVIRNGDGNQSKEGTNEKEFYSRLLTLSAGAVISLSYQFALLLLLRPSINI